MRENSSGMAGSVLLLVSASHFLNDMLQSIIPAALPLLKEENNLTFAEVGLITLVIQLTASLLQPVIGFSTDKRPMPMALPFGMMLSLIGLLFLAYSGTLSLILFSVALIGCGSAVFHPESARIAQEASGGRRGLAQAIFQVGGNGGAALGPIAAALIIIPYGRLVCACRRPCGAPPHPGGAMEQAQDRSEKENGSDRALPYEPREGFRLPHSLRSDAF